MNVGNTRRMPGTFDDFPEGFIFQTVLQQNGHIVNRTVMLRIMKSCAVTEMRLIHFQLLCLLIHQLHERLLGSGYIFRKRNTAFRAGRQHHSIQQVNGPHRFPRLKACLCRIPLIQSGKHFLVQRDPCLQIFQIFNRHNSRHHLCQRSRIDPLLPVYFSQNLTAPGLNQNCIGTVDSGNVQFPHCGFIQLLHPGFHTIIPADYDNQRKNDHKLQKDTDKPFPRIFLFSFCRSAGSRFSCHRFASFFVNRAAPHYGAHGFIYYNTVCQA